VIQTATKPSGRRQEGTGIDERRDCVWVKEGKEEYESEPERLRLAERLGQGGSRITREKRGERVRNWVRREEMLPFKGVESGGM